MATSETRPGQVIDIAAHGDANRSLILSTVDLQIYRLTIPSGTQIPAHRARGTIVVQCLKGHVTFTALDKTEELREGQLLYLTADETHSLEGIDDASLLVTVYRSSPDNPDNKDAGSVSTEPEFDVVQEASEESFPASDAPAWIPITRP